MSGDLRILFKKVDYTLDNLLTYIDIGDIGLPDIQRPFVWSSAKVRDLFDSMYRGFPIGYLLFWSSPGGNGGKQIGLDHKGHSVPNLLIVDGQQRLTSLYAVFRGKPVVDSDYRQRQIEIAFRPRDGKFEVADAAIRKDPEFVPSISSLWASGKSSHKLVKDFLGQLESKRQLSDSDQEHVAHNLDRLFDLAKYPFTALEIAPTVDEEQVADIFVRINSEGVKLKQGDFILTLLSVFWDEGRAELEKFSRESRRAPEVGSQPSPFNHFIHPDPDQLLRVVIALGFSRARLKSVYQLLRGKDLETGLFSPEQRQKQFDVLQQAQPHVLNLTHWHQFLHALVGAGYRSGEFVSSQIGLLYSYAMYLIGRTRFNVPFSTLDRLIGRWFWMVSLTSRYTGGIETIMDEDLSAVADLPGDGAFAQRLEMIIARALTDDFWTIRLPEELATSSTNSPAYNAYLASQVKLGAPVLFSNKKISDLLDPSLHLKKKAMDRHHLFPKAWLKSTGVEKQTDTNQVANYALLEWPDNIDISDDPPSSYVQLMRSRFNEHDWGLMNELHALPNGWESMPYEDFLARRRVLMADVIRRGFGSLA